MKEARQTRMRVVRSFKSEMQMAKGYLLRLTTGCEEFARQHKASVIAACLLILTMERVFNSLFSDGHVSVQVL